MWRRVASWVSVTLWALSLPAQAQALCDVTYKVQPGDTLFSIAAFHYDTAEKWTLIYYANPSVLQDQKIVAGSDLFIPCQQASAGPDATPLRQDTAEMTLLTGGNFAPFADRTWPGQGLATELVNAALEMSPAPVPYAVVWNDDWSAHLFPLLDEQKYDMGFPWRRPDCAASPDLPACTAFHYSDPLLDLPIMLFVARDRAFSFENDADLVGKRLCRPVGASTHDLDRPDRRWLSTRAVSLLRPQSAEACFEALVQGEVDAVTLNVFQGASRIVAMGLRGQVVPLEHPLSRETLHVVISKSHWRGTTHLYRINAGLAALRANGRYEEIVARHLDVFWDKLN